MRDGDKAKRSIKISFNPSDRIDEYIGVYEERFKIGFIKFWRKIGYILDREGIFFQDGSLLSHHLSANRDNWVNEVYWIRRAYPPTHDSIFDIYLEQMTSGNK